MIWHLIAAWCALSLPVGLILVRFMDPLHDPLSAAGSSRHSLGPAPDVIPPRPVLVWSAPTSPSAAPTTLFFTLTTTSKLPSPGC